MRLRFPRRARALAFAAVWSLTAIEAQAPGQDEFGSQSRDGGPRLPNGKLQRDEILKAEHVQNLKDAQQLVDLSQQLKGQIEKDDRYVLSRATLKTTDDIEKLVRKIRSRLRHE